MTPAVLERIRALQLTDPIVHAAYAAYGDEMEAICAALIAHVESYNELVAALEEAKTLQSFVVKVEVPDE